MKTKTARELGEKLKHLIQAGESAGALGELRPVLNQKIPFRIIGHIGEAVGDCALPRLFPYLDLIAETHTQGGWVIIGHALHQSYAKNPKMVLERCADYIVQGDVWYATDILGERVPGPALVADFSRALAHIEGWRGSPNPWVRRAVGVAVHLWAKRARGEAAFEPQAVEILTMLAPMFEEREIEAVKGIGWGLKPIGRMYPNLLTEWLIAQAGRPHRAIMLRKAVTYLADEQKEHVLERFARDNKSR